ncbi:hypothetical protein SEA_SATIS_224 [Streptomyces phage Satis]|nr:hypothetical protein SEA_SATIS_224 [Streptomyces phage Satis]
MADGRVECGVGVQDWWCLLDPGHGGGCIPRRSVEPPPKMPWETESGQVPPAVVGRARTG